MRSRRLLTLSLLPLLASPALAQAPAPAPIDLKALAAKGKKTLSRFATESVAWSVRFPSGRGEVRVDRASHKGVQLWVVSAGSGGRLQNIVRIVAKDGKWRVVESGGRRGIYRPYEFPFTIPQMMKFVTESEPTAVDPATLGKLVRRSDLDATYRLPLPAKLAAQLRSALKQLEQLGSTHAGDPQLAARARQVKQLLAAGILTHVDLTTGLVLGRDVPGKSWRLGRPVFDAEGLDDIDRLPVKVDELPDRSAPPAFDRPNDLLLIGHCGIWRRGMKQYGLDDCLLDLKTGAFRRVPFRGATSMTGCFLPGRKSVVVCGVDGGGIGLFAIDLVTRENKRLGGARLATGQCLFPVLSPDGKRLAVLHKALGTTSLLEVQVTLVDCETGAAEPVGKPLDTAFLNWLPDGKGLLLITRKSVGMDKPPITSLARMDLSTGAVTRLRAGDYPVLVRGASGQRILFRDEGRWNLCDLDGKNAAPLGGDGCPKLAFPTASPDGRQLIMMRVHPPNPPELVRVDLEGKITPVGLEPLKTGLWSRPAWR